MGLTAILYDFELALSNSDRKVFEELSFKLARHPSETMQRAWLRVLAYCWLWEKGLGFAPGGVSEPDAPDLETRDLTNRLTRWVRVGKADPGKIQRVIDQNSGAKVHVLFESPERLASFLEEAASSPRIAKAELAAIDSGLLKSLSALEDRRHKLKVTVSGDHFYVDTGRQSFDGPLIRGTT